jgi:hypothetical protein
MVWREAIGERLHSATLQLKICLLPSEVGVGTKLILW